MSSDPRPNLTVHTRADSTHARMDLGGFEAKRKFFWSFGSGGMCAVIAHPAFLAADVVVLFVKQIVVGGIWQLVVGRGRMLGLDCIYLPACYAHKQCFQKVLLVAGHDARVVRGCRSDCWRLDKIILSGLLFECSFCLSTFQALPGNKSASL